MCCIVVCGINNRPRTSAVGARVLEVVECSTDEEHSEWPNPSGTVKINNVFIRFRWFLDLAHKIPDLLKVAEVF